MHLLNNRFVIIDGVNQTFTPHTKLIKEWAQRDDMQFDQLLLIEKSRHKEAHFYYRIFNADGLEVGQCGNGALCVAQFLASTNLSQENPIRLATRTRFITLHLDNNDHVTANLGIPIFTPEKIPFIHNATGPMHTLETPFGHFDCCILSLGNPHCVLQVDDLKSAPVAKLGDYLNDPPHSYFPHGINVEFMKIKNPENIALRVFERGVGETQACGSGACAAVITGRLLNRLKKTVTVHLPGGQLQVHWQGDGNPVLLTGQGETIFQGEIDYP